MKKGVELFGSMINVFSRSSDKKNNTSVQKNMPRSELNLQVHQCKDVAQIQRQEYLKLCRLEEKIKYKLLLKMKSQSTKQTSSRIQIENYKHSISLQVQYAPTLLKILSVKQDECEDTQHNSSSKKEERESIQVSDFKRSETKASISEQADFNLN